MSELFFMFYPANEVGPSQGIKQVDLEVAGISFSDNFAGIMRG